MALGAAYEGFNRHSVDAMRLRHIPANTVDRGEPRPGLDAGLILHRPDIQAARKHMK